VKRKLNYDLEYVERHCAREDLRIMFRTVPVIVFKQGGW
jgi:lipopolysaccharide/colanic/teichoic acid biosynthesis glycosyltransferase